MDPEFRRPVAWKQMHQRSRANVSGSGKCRQVDDALSGQCRMQQHHGVIGREIAGYQDFLKVGIGRGIGLRAKVPGLSETRLNQAIMLNEVVGLPWRTSTRQVARGSTHD